MKVFLSHSTKDKQFVETLAAELEAEKIEPWLCEVDIEFGDNFVAKMGLAQQRYAKSHRILANYRGVEDFRRFRNSQHGTWFSRSVLGLDSDRILKLVLREIILFQEIQMLPGGHRFMGHRLQQFPPFGPIIDLGEFLRQIQVIPADDAILDEPFAGHLLVFLLRLQEFAWIADRDRAREGVDMLDAAEHLFNGHAQHGSSITRKIKTGRWPALRSRCTLICSAIRC
jgi:TIR domain